jgi:hypothetical protein
MMQLGGKLTAWVCHPTKRVNKAEELTYLSTNIEYNKQGILKGEYHYTIDLLFDWFGLVCFGNKNKNCHLSYS